MSVVLVSDEGHVRTIRLNRPEVKNAVSQELAWGVIGAFFIARLLTIRCNWRTAPLRDFSARQTLRGLWAWRPRKKGGKESTD